MRREPSVGREKKAASLPPLRRLTSVVLQFDADAALLGSCVTNPISAAAEAAIRIFFKLSLPPVESMLSIIDSSYA